MIVLLRWRRTQSAANLKRNYYNLYCERRKALRHRRRTVIALEEISRAAAVARAGRGPGGGKCSVHDAPDGTSAPPALGAAAEAMIDFAGRTRRGFARRERRPHIVIGEHVAGADDHCRQARRAIGKICNNL